MLIKMAGGEQFAEGYEDYFEEKMEICEDKNVVVIAGRPKEVYINTMIEKFQRFDQIEIQVLDAYLDRAVTIVKLWEAMGVLPVNGYPIRFETREEDIIPKDKSKKPYKGTINRLVISKIPQLYRHTHN